MQFNLFTPWLYGPLRTLASITDGHASLLFATCTNKFNNK
jgi:hypothetical protein